MSTIIKKPKDPFWKWFWSQLMNKLVVIFTVSFFIVLPPVQMYFRGIFFTDESIQAIVACAIIAGFVNIGNISLSYIDWKKLP